MLQVAVCTSVAMMVIDRRPYPQCVDDGRVVVCTGSRVVSCVAWEVDGGWPSSHPVVMRVFLSFVRCLGG